MPKIVELTVHEWNESSERHSLLSFALQSSGMIDTKIVDASFIHDLFQPFGAVTVRRMFGKEAIPLRKERQNTSAVSRSALLRLPQTKLIEYGDVA